MVELFEENYVLIKEIENTSWSSQKNMFWKMLVDEQILNSSTNQNLIFLIQVDYVEHGRSSMKDWNPQLNMEIVVWVMVWNYFSIADMS